MTQARRQRKPPRHNTTDDGFRALDSTRRSHPNPVSNVPSPWLRGGRINRRQKTAAIRHPSVDNRPGCPGCSSTPVPRIRSIPHPDVATTHIGALHARVDRGLVLGAVRADTFVMTPPPSVTMPLGELQRPRVGRHDVNLRRHLDLAEIFALYYYLFLKQNFANAVPSKVTVDFQKSLSNPQNCRNSRYFSTLGIKAWQESWKVGFVELVLASLLDAVNGSKGVHDACWR